MCTLANARLESVAVQLGNFRARPYEFANFRTSRYLVGNFRKNSINPKIPERRRTKSEISVRKMQARSMV